MMLKQNQYIIYSSRHNLFIYSSVFELFGRLIDYWIVIYIPEVLY